MSLVKAWVDDSGQVNFEEEQEGFYDPEETKKMNSFQNDFLDLPITANNLDKLKSELKGLYPNLKWAFTKTNLQILTETRDNFIWFAIGGKVEAYAISICFGIKNKKFHSIDMRKDPAILKARSCDDSYKRYIP